MPNFFQKTQLVTGLDISGSSVKLIQLEKSKSLILPKAYADIPLAKGLVINDEIADGKTFVYLMKQALEKFKIRDFRPSGAVASLPESKAFVRVIQLPAMSDGEIDNAVPFEAENFIPLPIDQVYLDWQKLESRDEKLNILIIASPKVFVDKYLSILDQAGINVAALEVESQSCRRALLAKDSRETLLILDLNAYRSSLIMVEKGALQFTSTTPIAGNTFTESIARTLGVSSAKAEEIKRKVGIINTPEYPNVKTALLPVLNNLSSEIKNILRFHADHSQEKVGRIILVGGSAKLKNLAEFLQAEFQEDEQLKIELGNPWLNLNLKSHPDFSALDALSYTTSIGLALRGLN